METRAGSLSKTPEEERLTNSRILRKRKTKSIPQQSDGSKQEPHSEIKFYLLPQEILGADDCNEKFHPDLLIKLGAYIPVSNGSSICHPKKIFF